MVSLVYFRPLSIAKINVFLLVHASLRGPCTNYDLWSRCVKAPVSVYSNIALNILTLT